MKALVSGTLLIAAGAGILWFARTNPSSLRRATLSIIGIAAVALGLFSVWWDRLPWPDTPRLEVASDTTLRPRSLGIASVRGDERVRQLADVIRDSGGFVHDSVYLADVSFFNVLGKSGVSATLRNSSTLDVVPLSFHIRYLTRDGKIVGGDQCEIGQPSRFEVGCASKPLDVRAGYAADLTAPVESRPSVARSDTGIVLVLYRWAKRGS